MRRGICDLAHSHTQKHTHSLALTKHHRIIKTNHFDNKLRRSYGITSLIRKRAVFIFPTSIMAFQYLRIIFASFCWADRTPLSGLWVWSDIHKRKKKKLQATSCLTNIPGIIFRNKYAHSTLLLCIVALHAYNYCVYFCASLTNRNKNECHMQKKEYRHNKRKIIRSD